MTAQQPNESTVSRVREYVDKYRAKIGTATHPEPQVTEAIGLGLAANVEPSVDRCPCNYYSDKQAEVDGSREWVCACDEMKTFKYSHCLLFVNSEGKPVTEYLPEDHEGHEILRIGQRPVSGQRSGSQAPC